MRGHFIRSVIVLAWAALLMPAAAWAQAQGAIGGTVRDSSGLALPGVTVEAASDALIEKVRTAVTDENGQYLIIDLRQGTYNVTFALPGFRTVSRTGLMLSTGVTLPINTQMEVGGVEETVTVSGDTPVVDVANTRQQVVFDRELLDEIPRSRASGLTARLLPGVTPPVSGGVSVSSGAAVKGSATLAVHGGRTGDMTTNIDGMAVHDFSGGGGQNSTLPSDGSVQEYTYEVGAITAETRSGGIKVNIVPKEGGNAVHGLVAADMSNGWAADNLNDALRKSGLTQTEELDKVFEINPAFGGPLLHDRLWFFGSYKKAGNRYFPPGAVWETHPGERPHAREDFWSANVRLTWQASARNKFSTFFENDGRDYEQDMNSTTTVEAANRLFYPKLWLGQVKWTAPVTDRLLLEAGVVRHEQELRYMESPSALPGAWPVQDVSTGVFSGNTFRLQNNPNELTVVSSAISYVTGSHSFKVGFQHSSGSRFREHLETLPLLRVRNGVPFEVQLEAKPALSKPWLNHDLGVFAQDQWKLNRLTANVGLRFDYLNAQLLEQSAPANAYVPARHFDAIKNLPNWKDLSPRLGLVYDLSGDGRTAIKASASRYVVFEAINFAQSLNPLTQGSGTGTGQTDRRAWNDLNGDRIPQANELGPSTNLNFGLPVLAVLADPDLAQGWHKRQFDWEYELSVQHELLPGLAASAGYFRRTFGNLVWTQNTQVQQSDFTPFTINSPLDGTPITLYNLDPAKRGLTSSLQTFAPDNSEIYNGFEGVVNGRLKGITAMASATIGRTSTKTCTASDPNALRFCDVTPPFGKEAIYKTIITYRLPFQIQASGVFQSTPGTRIAANYTVTSALAGRTLTNSSILVNLVEPGSMYTDRSNSLDVRLAKSMTGGRVTFQPSVEIFNLLNAAPILAVNNTYGANWLQPSNTLLGRMLKLGMKVEF